MIEIFQRIGSIVFLSFNFFNMGTTSYETDVSSAKYTSNHKTAKEVMDELKELQY